MKRVMLGAVAAFAAATVFADYTYYVRQNGGNDNNNGTSYETAFATYGKALAKAKTCNSTKTPDDTGYQIKRIYVYPGEYHVAPRNAEGKPYANNQEISIGAYNIWTIGVNDDGSGDERTPAAAGEVVLDGDNVMRCFTSQYPTGMRFYNLTMQNGLAAGSYAGNGGLLLVNGVNNVVSNCIFRNATANRGGAIYGSSGMSTPIYDSKFYNCAATNGNGGAIYYVNQASNNMDQRFVRCDFINCSASNGSAASGESVKGGVLYLPTSDTYTNGFYFTDCNFVSNSCSGCGGVFSGPVLWATNCTFRDNVANCDGSIGHTTVTGTYMPNRTNNFVDCVFVGNVAKALSGGDAIAGSKHVGGLLVSYSDYATEVHRCLFANNVSYGFCGVIGRLDSGKQRIWMFDSVVTNNIIKGDVLDPIMEKAESTQKTYEYSGVLRGAGGSVVSNCIISGNSSYGSAYVLSLGDGSKVYDSVFTDNVGKECPGKTGTSTVWGGALSGSTKNLVRNCLICRNWRQSANGNGAAVFSIPRATPATASRTARSATTSRRRIPVSIPSARV